MNLFEHLDKAARRCREELHRLEQKWRPTERQSTLMLQLFRPNLGPTPTALRRVLEPVVAASAVMALFGLLTLGATSLTLFLLAGALMYLIITRVFGIELDMQMPASNF